MHGFITVNNFRLCSGILTSPLFLSPNSQAGLSRMAPGSEAVVDQLRMVMRDSDTSSDDDNTPEPTDKNLSRDYTVAMTHYRYLRALEVSNAPKPGWFGGMTNKDKEDARRSQSMLQQKRKYSNLRKNSSIARQLQALPTFTPYFIYGITFIQVDAVRSRTVK